MIVYDFPLLRTIFHTPVNGLRFLWNSYTNYIRKNVLTNHYSQQKDIAYWRNEIFLNVLLILAPVSILALVPGVYMAILHKIPVIGYADLIAFGMLILIMSSIPMKLAIRKFILIIVIYGLSLILLDFLGRTGPSLLFLLVLTIFSAVIYSPLAAYYSACANFLICIVFGICIAFRINSPFAAEYDLGTWIAVSSNLVLLSFVSAWCLNLLLSGLKISLDSTKTIAANLYSIIENTDAYIYSLDCNFRFITFNKVMHDQLKQVFNIDIKIGDNAFEFLEKNDPEEALFWKNTYTDALKGSPIKFERDHFLNNTYITTSFTLSAINDDGKVTGLSCIATDITEAKNAERQIQKLNNDLELKVAERTSQLQLSNQELEAFSFSISHDLRAPLRAINGYTAMLMQDFEPTLNPEVCRIINNISTQGKKMSGLIDDLLAFSKISRKELRKEIIGVQAMVENICAEIKAEDKSRGIHFEIDKLIAANGDLIAINQVWVNLISNAVKYTRLKEKAIIKIGSEIKSGKVIYYIKDNGAGFDMRYADKLFCVFQRLHSDEEFEGTGVGLATVQRIVVKHGGKLWAQAEVNKGASFYFTLN